MTSMQPVTCPYCHKPAQLVDGTAIYLNRPDLAGKNFYLCDPCDAYVGCHPAQTPTQNGVGDGTVPMGRLANAELRRAKNAAHAAFDPLWKSGRMHRKAAYKWLSKALGLTSQQTHIGMFDVDQCAAVVAAVKART